MNKFRIILGVLFLLMFGLVFFYLKINKPCTLEAKVCPDGSFVSRAGPNCEFAPCPNQITAPSDFINQSQDQTEQNKDANIKGSIMVYHVYESNVTVQLTAESTKGKITHMQVWTDSKPATDWQPFNALASLPWQPNDQVYVRFRDQYGNISETYSDSVAPRQGPPN